MCIRVCVYSCVCVFACVCIRVWLPTVGGLCTAVHVHQIPTVFSVDSGRAETDCKLFFLLHSRSQAGQEAQQTRLGSFLAERWENLTMSTEASGCDSEMARSECAESKLKPCSGSVLWACQERPCLEKSCTGQAELIGITDLAA